MIFAPYKEITAEQAKGILVLTAFISSLSSFNKHLLTSQYYARDYILVYFPGKLQKINVANRGNKFDDR